MSRGDGKRATDYSLAMPLAHLHLFLTTMPKAGTHLLLPVLEELMACRSAFVPKPAKGLGLHNVLQTMGLPRLAHGHLRADCGPPQEAYRTIALVRDPRDVLLSMRDYLLDRRSAHPRHLRTAAFLETLPAEAQLRALCDGVDTPQYEITPLEDHCHGFHEWREHGLVLTYRELIHSPERLSEFLGVDAGPALAARVGRPGTTFNVGRVGRWKDELTGPTLDYVWYRVGHLVRQLGFSDESDSPGPTRPELHDLALAAIAEADWPRAETVLQRMLASWPEDLWATERMFAVKHHTGDLAGLADCALVIRGARPADLRVARNCAAALVAAGRTDETIDVLRAAMATWPGDRWLRTRLVQILLAGDRFTEAAQVLLEAGEEMRRQQAVALRVAIVKGLLGLDQLDAASSVLLAGGAEVRSARAAGVRISLAEALVTAGRTAEALAVFDAGGRELLSPRAAKTRLRIAAALVEADRTPEALDLMSRDPAALQSARASELRRSMARRLSKSGRFELAFEVLTARRGLFQVLACEPVDALTDDLLDDEVMAAGIVAAKLLDDSALGAEAIIGRRAGPGAGRFAGLVAAALRRLGSPALAAPWPQGGDSSTPESVLVGDAWALAGRAPGEPAAHLRLQDGAEIWAVSTPLCGQWGHEGGPSTIEHEPEAMVEVRFTVAEPDGLRSCIAPTLAPSLGMLQVDHANLVGRLVMTADKQLLAYGVHPDPQKPLGDWPVLAFSEHQAVVAVRPQARQLEGTALYLGGNRRGSALRPFLLNSAMLVPLARRFMDLDSFDHVIVRQLLSARQKQWLAAFGVPIGKLVELPDEDETVAIDRLWVVTPPFRRERLGGPGGGSPTAVHLARQALLPAAASGARRAGRWLWLSRADTRQQRIALEEELEALASSLGFEVVVMGALDVGEQVRLMGEAEIVAGVKGSQMATAFLAPPHAHLIEITPDKVDRPDNGILPSCFTGQTVWRIGAAKVAGGEGVTAPLESLKSVVHAAAAALKAMA